MPLGLQKMREYILRQQFSNFSPGATYTLKKYQRPQRIFAFLCYIYLIIIQYINLIYIYHIRN